MKYGVKALAWGMLDVLVDGHFDVVQQLDDEIESLEDLLFDQVNSGSRGPAPHLRAAQVPGARPARGAADARSGEHVDAA